MTHDIPHRELGRTGVQVSIIGVGGAHLGVPDDPADAVRIVRGAVDRGITFMDCSWDYGAGESERRLGQALQDDYRERAFLMTKVDGRSKRAALDQLDESLRRLRTDCVDLWQLHEIIRFSDVDRIFAPGGAIEALDAARQAGKVRFVGFTGHKDPAIHLKMLEQDYPWDTVQLPLNVLDAHYRSFEQQVLPVLVDRNIGVIGMKPLCAGELLETKTVSAIEALHYAMHLPTDVVVTGIQSQTDLEQAVEAATSFRPMREEQTAALLARTATAARNGRQEGYKTRTGYDSTTAHPEWMEAA